ncbi:hypothetical protein ACHQM5_011777 [Ranunculus cassubicifolius]
MEVRKWQYLQGDCLVKIFQKLGIEAMMKAVPFVCKSWYKTSLDPLCWKYLIFSYEFPTQGMKTLVDRSCGTAVELVFGTHLRHDDFIYISKRCPKVNVVRLPQFLKTLQVSCSWDSEISLKEVSIITSSLPKIKGLILGKSTEIARESLLTLLSGCKELIRVDVRECFGFDADDEEILKMASRIKVFMAEGSRRHNDLKESLYSMTNEEIDLEQICSLAEAIAEI